MKYCYLLIAMLSTQLFWCQESQTTTNWEEAKEMAASNDKHILIVMTGNEWCSTSRDMRKRVLESDVFERFTAANVITYIIDIKNEGCDGESKEELKYQKFSDLYNTNSFPAMVLVDNTGEKIKTLEGKLYKRKNVMAQLQPQTRL